LGGWIQKGDGVRGEEKTGGEEGRRRGEAKRGGEEGRRRGERMNGQVKGMVEYTQSLPT
jgi:hypothetical protein